MHCTFQMSGNASAGRIAGLFSVLLLLAFPVPEHAAANVDTILQRWSEANRLDFKAAQEFSYFERIQDDDGVKTYAVTMVLGSPYKQLVRKNGTTAEDAEQLEQADASARSERNTESADARRKRIEKYQKTLEEAHRILEEMPHAFDYRLQSTQRSGSRMLYVLSATPRQGYDPPNTEARVLTGMQGEFWIDAETCQLFRGSARVLHPVTIDEVATIQPGTEFEVDQRPVPGGAGVWLPTHFSIHSRSSIAFLFHHHTSEDRTFFNFRMLPRE